MSDCNLIEEVKKQMKEPRPEDLDSSLTLMCDYAKKLIDELEFSRAKNVILTADVSRCVNELRKRDSNIMEREAWANNHANILIALEKRKDE